MKQASGCLKDNISSIMTIWKESVTNKVFASNQANNIELYDHLPNIINDIADILERYSEFKNEAEISDDTTYNEILTNSINHGRHRSASTSYTQGQVVHEYIIFHRTLSDFLAQNNLLSIPVSNLLKYVIETCILKSVESFTQSIQKMQTKLMGTLAHDIRNPLTVALLSAEMMEKNLDDETFIKLQRTSIRSIKKTLKLAEGLLDTISIKSGEGMMLNFTEENILHDIEWIYKEAQDIYSCEIIMDVPDQGIIGIFDGTAIRRMLENLITNAIKYGNASLPITIKVKDEADVVCISVHNHGNPIAKEKQKEIFNFLKSNGSPTDMRIASWGMGLTLVQMVVSAHGGEISIESNSDKGTTFTAKLYKYYNQKGKKRAGLAFA
ncbi:sensor histidine kinase [Fulvivirga sediminis]|uniref:histidine kinase n=1 Tax=Fulvivirga sediminis TaxID=2803949 RepID=A0A937F8W5_9BACT|nr:HAMP domain-containing sensor histidine kinase [Fulvivirga sediminis]MBL3657860.1 HAMP domain-containing histidine kinase [Fulvivirga sediminis]